jgi:protein SCO1/2
MRRSVAALVITTALTASACASRSSPPSPPASEFTGFPISAPFRLPDVPIDATVPTRLAAAAGGKTTVTFLGYTHCPDACPLTMATITSALHKLSKDQRDRVRVLFITVDPARDDIATLRSWLARFDPSIVGVTAGGKQLATIYTAFGLPAPEPKAGSPDGAIDHVADTVVFAPDGTALLSYDNSMTDTGLAADITKLLGGQRPAPPSDADLLTSGGIARSGLLSVFFAYLDTRANQPSTLTLSVANQATTSDTLDDVVINGQHAALPAGGIPIAGGDSINIRDGRITLPALTSESTAVDATLHFTHAGALQVRVPIRQPR